nr:kunitz-type U19-barytoxin-Tl1a-like [Crassostrea virginica]
MGQTWHLQCDPGCHLVGTGELTCVGVPDPFHHVAIWDTFQGSSKCEKNPIDTKRSPPYLTSSGKETNFKVTETESEDSVCLQPKKPGPCKARMERFYFDQKTKSCKEFIYGGCQRNDNNFKTQEECEEKCYN